MFEKKKQIYSNIMCSMYVIINPSIFFFVINVVKFNEELLSVL